MKYFVANMLPKADVIWTDDETCVDITGQWETYAKSLCDFANLTRPNILIEHEVKGGTHGRVEKAWYDDKGIWSKIGLDETTLPKDQKYRWVSPRIAWHHRDVNGKEWPAALLECSLVSIPRFLVGQSDLQETKMSQAIKPALNSVSQLACSKMQEQPTEADMTPEILEALRALIREELTAKMADTTDPSSTSLSDGVEIEVSPSEPSVLADPLALMAGTDPTQTAMQDPLTLMADPSVTPFADPASVVADPTLLSGVDPAAYVAQLSEDQKVSMLTDVLTKLAQTETEALMSQVKAVCISRGIPANKMNAFYQLAKKDKRAFVSAMSAIPVTRTKTSPNTVAARNSGGNDNIVERAVALARQGKGSFTENYRKLGGK